MGYVSHATRLVAAAALLGSFAAPAHAVVGYADVVLEFFNSGASLPGSYGGIWPTGPFPVAVSPDVVLGPDGDDTQDFLSLSLGSYVTVGFTDEILSDGAGLAFFVTEVGNGGESANVFVSADNVTFSLIGIATADHASGFDLASIGFTGPVQSLRIVGRDNFGTSPGFDLANIRVVPEPASWAMMIAGFGLIGVALRRRLQGAVALA